VTLQSWLQNSWLIRHIPNKQEIGNLLKLADRDLAACRIAELPADWRFSIAYNAALQAATVALAAAGYRAARDNHPYRVIQSLEFTITPDSKVIETFDGFRKKRNISSYDLAGTVSDREADEMMQLAHRLRDDVEK
jgi:hypothetical protein